MGEPVFPDVADIELLNYLSRKELLRSVSGQLSVSHSQQSKGDLVMFVLTNASSQVLQRLKETGQQRMRRKRKRGCQEGSERGDVSIGSAHGSIIDEGLLIRLSRRQLLECVLECGLGPGRGRRKADLARLILDMAPREVIARLCRRVDEEGRIERRMACGRWGGERGVGGAAFTDGDISQFMKLPSEEERKRRWRMFYEATSAEQLATSICAVCARELMTMKDDVQKIVWAEVPGKAKLRPVRTHPAHFLVDGCLLQSEGVLYEEDGLYVQICKECLAHLYSDKMGAPPFSLANGLWIGDCPQELQQLTVVEQKLIALVYLRLHVYKLFPQMFCGEGGLQRAMRGNLCSYPLDVEKAVEMVEGNLMPRKLDILPSLIALLYVGSGKLPMEAMKKLLRVRRERVREALLWLKRNNPKYYGNIQIDENNLRQLPEDDLPEEIKGIIRRSEDEGMIDDENESYVPVVEDMCSKQVDRERDIDPDVVPLDLSGMVDSELHDLHASDMMAHALVNANSSSRECAYAVRYGNRPVSTFGASSTSRSENPDSMENFFEKAFPCLYPYGCGGIEAPRQTTVGFREHVRWALQFHDRRFRTHESFPLVAFSILQRREALLSAKMRVRRQDAHILENVTLDMLKKAVEDEASGHEPSDIRSRQLRQYVHCSLSHVIGCNEVRRTWRSQIWSTNLIHGPPSLWLTINPSDIHDPIAQVFAGADIDLDNFLHSAHMDGKERANRIANDPYAAAKFFHFMIETILVTLFGIEVTPFQVKSELGTLGEVGAYFGVVECQNRGTLHFHCLLWLKNAPSPDQMQSLLQTRDFQDRVCQYVKANVRAYVPGLESAESIHAIPVSADIAFNRPPNPDHENYDEEVQSFELRLARAVQIHVCKRRRCLKEDKTGRWVCKRRAPFSCSDHDYVTEDGKWGCKRLYEYVNAWNPDVLINARCNNDLKLLTQGKDTRNITFYVAFYATKPQLVMFNYSALLNGYKYHIMNSQACDAEAVQDHQKKLLFRLMNAACHQQEIAAPLAVSHLMGYGDVYRSHTYTTIYWSAFAGVLKKCFPYLRGCNQAVGSVNGESSGQNRNEETEPENNEMAYIEINFDGGLHTQNQVQDYALRGDGLDNCDVLSFFMNTYEQEIDKDGDQETSRGRRRNQRFAYKQEHWKVNKKTRVQRSEGHRNLPNIIGQWFPRNDIPNQYPYYCASMLMLLKPWRNLGNDLKRGDQRWEDAFRRFVDDHPHRGKIEYILSNIQFFHECDSAAQDVRKTTEEEIVNFKDTRGAEDSLDLNGAEEGENPSTVQILREAQVSWAEHQHAQVAIDIAELCGFFQSGSYEWDANNNVVKHANSDDEEKLIRWKQEMQMQMPTENTNGLYAEYPRMSPVVPTVQPLVGAMESTSPLWDTVSVAENSLTAIDPAELNKEQRRAYDIVTWHLLAMLSGQSPPPLRMIMCGEGGTGKSKVIQTISATFEQNHALHLLQKTAYTGIAASLINGKTMHALGNMSIGKGGRLTSETRRRLQRTWSEKKYLIIDEFSMIGKSFMAKFANKIRQGRDDLEEGDKWAGLSIVLCGDFHQFPPVALGRKEYLYIHLDPAGQGAHQNTGQQIYEEFRTVVLLKEQKRVHDEVWRAFLARLRNGKVTKKDLSMLRSLILSPSNNVNSDEEPWKDAYLITPRHAVRLEWNKKAVRKTCQERGQRLFICTAQDKLGDRRLTAQESLCVGGRKSSKNGRGLPEEIEITVGMKILVTYNLETDLDITNGARGIIVDIILDSREEITENESICHLRYLPRYILVRLDRTRISHLSHLHDNVIPIEPMTVSMELSLPGQHKMTIKRTQYPITGAYAFTDYRSQGQTIAHSIIDIAPPPNGSLSLFNLYVALSRSPGRDHIRLLREFKDEMLLKNHDGALLKEDERLQALDRMTERWYEETVKGHIR